MKIFGWLVLLHCVLVSPVVGETAVTLDLREGDIIFTGSPAGQGEAIIAATASPYTHCGVVVRSNGELVVLEAVQPVRTTALTDFVARGGKGPVAYRRLKTPVKPENLRKALAWGKSQIGKNYDPHFRWDDQALYCSELVWKFFRQAGVRLCDPRRFRDYQLQRPEVQKIIVERYQSVDRLPLDETVVAPSDLVASALLGEIPKSAAAGN